MPARALGPAVLVDGDTLPTLRWCVAVAVREKRRNGTRPGPILAALDHATGRPTCPRPRPTLNPMADCRAGGRPARHIETARAAARRHARRPTSRTNTVVRPGHRSRIRNT